MLIARSQTSKSTWCAMTFIGSSRTAKQICGDKVRIVVTFGGRYGTGVGHEEVFTDAGNVLVFYLISDYMSEYIRKQIKLLLNNIGKQNMRQ